MLASGEIIEEINKTKEEKLQLLEETIAYYSEDTSRRNVKKDKYGTRKNDR